MFYKRALCETGDALVEIVFDILENILGCDLSGFVDKFGEDFRIELGDVTFIGEIKGIGKNVGKGNVSQVENHCQNYNDEDESKHIKGLLVINSQRDKPLNEREPVHVDCIELAKKYGVLIIPAYELLKIFGRFKSGTLSSDKIVKAFEEQIGLIDTDAIG